MKRLLVALFSLGLLFLLPGFAHAQENLMITVSPQPTPTQTIQYDMPYPGLLPDSPLYFLKTARDQIVGFLISNPSKKAAFDLLQSDKRFEAGLMLYQKDPSKRDLAFTTLSKGHNYLEEAISKVAEAKRQGVEVGDIGQKILLSIKKQKQVLMNITTPDAATQKDIQMTLQRLNTLQSAAEKNVLSAQDKSK